jgi:hypothetical protein
MSHVICTQGNRVDSRLLVVGSQTANLTPGPSFAHNLCCRCWNGSCEAIFDSYASRPFQRYKHHFKARCFGPCNRVLSFWESRRTPKSPFRECECHPHTPSKWGCDTNPFVLVGYVGYKLGSKGTKKGMTLYHIGYVEVSNILVLLSTIGVTGCNQVV